MTAAVSSSWSPVSAGAAGGASPLPPDPRPQLAHPLASPDLDAIAAAQAHGDSLREIARHLDTHASTLSRRLRRHPSGSTAATNGTWPLLDAGYATSPADRRLQQTGPGPCWTRATRRPGGLGARR
ncbi:MAG: helix-turn-helix domain-containing protein [Thermoleophilia bacterium]|nr:helix-turn-helix domain-containing protein [Thermoleophilia bacterium]